MIEVFCPDRLVQKPKKKPENWGVTERKRKIKEVKHIIEEEAVEE